MLNYFKRKVRKFFTNLTLTRSQGRYTQQLTAKFISILNSTKNSVLKKLN